MVASFIPFFKFELSHPVFKVLIFGCGLSVLIFTLILIERQRRKTFAFRRELALVQAENFTSGFFPDDAQGESNRELSELIQRCLDPDTQFAASRLYQPISVWTGLLILPSNSQRSPEDWVFFEVHNAAHNYQNLVGKIVKLKWSNHPEIQLFVRAAIRDIYFTKQTEISKKSGNLHPDRLHELKNVGPLESFAGARTKNDVTVMLPEPVAVISRSRDRHDLIIEKGPIQITGRLCALVRIITREQIDGDRFLVRHFNQLSQAFDGCPEIIRIPQVQPDKNGVCRSTINLIEKSHLNKDGWYIYGEKGEGGIFIVQAIEPRTTVKVIPDEVHFGRKETLAYINRKLWENTPAQKGLVKTVLLAISVDKHNNISPWQEGDRGIVIHTFGGIGGKKGEPAPFGIVTGHFSYGVAKVVRDRFTDELRFDIEYWQVYAHNSDGIVAGSIKSQSYLGDLQRGWLGNRPICDVICKLDCVCQDYDFDGIKLSPIAELNRQLDIMMARYRTGDGTGGSLVTPATSCVQDSNQALYAAIKQVTAQIESNSEIQNWLRGHPNHEQSIRFQQLLSLGWQLQKKLVPFGIVRPDWYRNAKLAGINYGKNNNSLRFTNLLQAAMTWRTVLPRRSQDEIATILLKEGAILSVIRTNQLGGFDPDIEPCAPTALLGHRTR